MAENDQGQEKTEQPTSKRRDKSRQEGQVARSQEINFVAGLMAALIYFALQGSAMVEGIESLLRWLFTDVIMTDITQESAMSENMTAFLLTRPHDIT